MVRIIILLFYSFSYVLFAQTSRFFIGGGATGTSRFMYSLKEFSEEEADELKSLEVMTPSYHMHLGYTFLRNPKVSLKAGIEYRRTRFGSRKYQLPRDVHNSTPQYLTRKENVVQKQTGIFLETTLHRIRPILASSLFFKLGIIRNHREYHISEVTYDGMGKRGIIGTSTSNDFVPHRTDIQLTTGLNYYLFQIRKNPIYIQPALSIFGRAYHTSTHWGYLYFRKNFSSYLWEFGITARYEFAGWHKKEN